MCCGVFFFFKQKTAYEMNAWLGLAGSMAMVVMKRPGELAAVLSMRWKPTEAAESASAFLETKTRRVVVAPHSVELSPVVRESAATLPPLRLPNAALVSRSGPSAAQSPQVTV